MGLRFENLDDITRQHSANECDLGGHYESPRLTEEGRTNWAAILKNAILRHDDDWLAGELLDNRYIVSQEDYTRNHVTRQRNINKPKAALQLAEGEFNRFYLRGLCCRAIEEGIDHLIVYRAKETQHPRPESEMRIGQNIDVEPFLEALRTTDFVAIENVFGVPGGPNSGISAKLP